VKPNKPFCRFAMLPAVLVTLAALGAFQMSGTESRTWAAQEGLSIKDAPEIIRAAPGVPIDWTTRHVIFSSSSSAATQQRVREEPRFWIQMLSRRWRQRADAAKSFRAQPGHVKGAWYQALADQTYNLGRTHPTTYPAKYVFTTTSSASCSDWVVFGGPQGGSPADFSIIAFKNLYPGCGGPTLKFAYDGSTNGGALVTAPVISLDGTQIAYVETGNPTLDILYLPATDSGDSNAYPIPNPSDLLPACNGSYPPTNRPCLYTFGLVGDATTSAPFVDYATDTGWVTDDDGNVYEIHPFFDAAPTTGTLTPAFTTSTTHQLSAPTWDPASRRLFFTDSGGALWAYNGATATGVVVSTSSQTNVEPPLVDSSTEEVFVFSAGNLSGVGSSVVQIPAAFSGSTSSPPNCTALFSPCVVGSIGSGITNPIRIGTANNTYFSGENGGSAVIPTGGLMYVCGNNAGNPSLYAFSFSPGGVMNSSPAAAIPLALSAACSPLTENYDGTTDRLFLGLTANCPNDSNGDTGSPTGCIEYFNITSGYPSSSTPAYTSASAGGTTGIIVDNETASEIGNLNIYFMTAKAQTCSTFSGGADSLSSCAVSLTQATLK
jgi:hypothetical protein